MSTVCKPGCGMRTVERRVWPPGHDTASLEVISEASFKIKSGATKLVVYCQENHWLGTVYRAASEDVFVSRAQSATYGTVVLRRFSADTDGVARDELLGPTTRFPTVSIANQGQERFVYLDVGWQDDHQYDLPGRPPLRAQCSCAIVDIPWDWLRSQLESKVPLRSVVFPITPEVLSAQEPRLSDRRSIDYRDD